MDPLSALLLAMWIAGHFTKNVYQDAVFKARGEDPPSFRREQARRERRAQKDKTAKDGPGRQFWRNAWVDAVASAEDRRERVAAKAAEKRRAKWAEKDLADAEDEAHKVNDRLNANDRPAAVVPDTTEPPVVTGQCHFCDKEFPPEHLWPARDDDATVASCRPCWLKRNQAPQGQEPEPASPAPAVPEPGDAEIIQFADWQRPAASPATKEDPMSAEITGLRSAITYTSGGAAAATQAAGQDELAIAGLHAGGTTGAAIAHLTAAMEGHHLNVGHYNAARNDLTRQLVVTEAYESNQGAGTREFVTNN